MKLTISEVASHCGYKSPTTVYRLQRSGMLRDYEVGRDGRNLLLESNPPGRCPIRDHIASCLQLHHDSPLAQRSPGSRRNGAAIQGMNDAQLAAWVDEHMSDERLEQAMKPIDAYIDSQGCPEGPNWELTARYMAEFLPDWPAPPWDADQLATLSLTLAMAEELAAGNG